MRGQAGDVPRRARARSSPTCGAAARDARRHPRRRSTSPSDGEYRRRRRRHGHPTSGATGMEFREPARVPLDGKIVYETVIGGEEEHEAYDQCRTARSIASTPPEEHPLTRDRRTAPDRRGVQAPDVRRSDDQLQMFAPGRRAGPAIRSARSNCGPFGAEGARERRRARALVHVPSSGPRPPGRVTLRQGDHWVAGQAAPIAGRSPPRTSTKPAAYYRGRLEGRRVRGRRPQRRHRDVGQSVLPVPRRTPAGRGAAGRHLRDHRSRAGVEAVVLPVELDPRRRAGAAGDGRRLSAPVRAGPAGPAHAGRPAVRGRWRTTSCPSGST